MPNVQVELEKILRAYCTETGKKVATIKINDNLINDLGLESDEGLDLVLQIEDVFEISIPVDVNPIVNEDQNRGATFGELVALVQTFIGGGAAA